MGIDGKWPGGSSIVCRGGSGRQPAAQVKVIRSRASVARSVEPLRIGSECTQSECRCAAAVSGIHFADFWTSCGKLFQVNSDLKTAEKTV
jgi:hypothetical protein